MKQLILIGLTLISYNTFAESFVVKCPDIAACAKVVGEMLDQKYIFDADVKGKAQATPNLDLNPENAELLFTNMLHMNGYSRVPLGQSNTFQIMRHRDARDSAIPSINSDRDTAPKLPESWDMFTLTYKATYPEGVEHLARMSRSFMPANARIIPASGALVITDSAMNLKKLYGLIRDLDKKPTPEMKKQWEDQERSRRLREIKEEKEATAPPAK